MIIKLRGGSETRRFESDRTAGKVLRDFSGCPYFLRTLDSGRFDSLGHILFQGWAKPALKGRDVLRLWGITVGGPRRQE
ncbi:hypothetical protein [Oscillibacter ruminantium]